MAPIPPGAARILVVDDDQGHRAMLRATLRAEGYEVVEAGDGQEALDQVADRAVDLVLLDLRMPRMDGETALAKLRERNPALPILIMTAYGSVDTAVNALKAGAYDYLTKPLDTDELLLSLARTLEHFQLKAENRALRDRLGEGSAFSGIIGRSPAMHELIGVLETAAPSDANIFLTGESGTGKDLVARAIHDASERCDGPFVAVSCAAIPGPLLESELFGHERGAFTGAVRRHLGKFEQAHGGTIFLDEIGDMPPELQAKLLRVLQSRQVERLGGEELIEVDVRVVSATNIELEAAIADRTFRRDLYYRLAVISAHLPELRQRQADIPLLADHFLAEYAARNDRALRGFTPAAMDLLTRYGWPGNVRELENAVERAVILSQGEFIDADGLPEAVRGAGDAPEPGTGVRGGHSVEEVMRELILKTLEQTDGNRTEASRLLGISRQTLLTRLKEYGDM